jgi:hypothetical protein
VVIMPLADAIHDHHIIPKPRMHSVGVSPYPAQNVQRQKAAYHQAFYLSG